MTCQPQVSPTGKESDFSSSSDFSIPPKAGNVTNKVREWSRVSQDPWLISTIQGVEIPFMTAPRQLKEPRPYKLSEEENAFVDEELLRMLEQGIVEEAEPSSDQVVSNIFLRPKKDGRFRLILDLTWLNEHVEYEHFKMHSLHTALDMMRPGC